MSIKQYNDAGTFSTTLSAQPTANRTITVPDGSGTLLMGESIGRRNYLINGNFDKWDYATSQTASAYGSDNRWLNEHNGSSKTHLQVACGDAERALFNAMYFSRNQVSSSSGSTNFITKDQKIENVNLLAGKTVTLSFWAKADTNRNIAIEFVQYFGTGGSPSAGISGIGSQLVALTTTWKKFSITVTIPSIVGKTLGTDGVQTTYTALFIWLDAGSGLNNRTANLGQQSGTFDIAQVKIEDGSVATTGWHPYDGEFGGDVQACARYYETLPSMVIGGYSSASATEHASYSTSLKRITPTITTSAVSYANSSGITTAPHSNSGTFRVYVTVTGTGGFNATVSYTLSAEL